MYKTTAQKRDEDKQQALLWLFLTSRGLVEEFTAFCKANRDRTVNEIDNEIKQLTQKTIQWEK
jgi:uncharacterized protein YydD (DUF2326 family)